jgi:hypothetical protein
MRFREGGKGGGRGLEQADRAEMHPGKSNGSIGQAADMDGYIVADPAHSLEAPAPAPGDAVAALTQRIDQLIQEVAGTRRQAGQVEATLAKRTGRMHQLIGERDRLASLLAARDAELLRLTRELGALSERAAPAARGSSTLFAAAGALLDRIRHVRKAPAPSKPAIASAAVMEHPPVERPLLPWVRDGAPKPVMGVAVFGLSEAEIESVLGIVERHCAERDLAPLLLTDNDAFQLFRGRRVLFEFLPARADQERFAADLDWRLFTLRRLALIRRKWQPVRVIAFGRLAAEVVQLWLDSPFEATPIPASLKGRSEGAEPAWGGAPLPSAMGA